MALKLFHFITLIFCILCVEAQPNAVIIHQNKRVDVLYQQANTIIACPKCVRSYKSKGYRILFRITNNRKEAYDLKAKLKNSYSNYSVYMSYQSSYFRLKMGDFISKKEAEHYSNILNKKFHFISTVIPDIINYNKHQENEEPLCTETTPSLTL